MKNAFHPSFCRLTTLAALASLTLGAFACGSDSADTTTTGRGKGGAGTVSTGGAGSGNGGSSGTTGTGGGRGGSSGTTGTGGSSGTTGTGGSSGTTGAAGRGGAAGTGGGGGAAGSGAGTGGSSGTAGTGGGTAIDAGRPDSSSDGGAGDAPAGTRFSFFVTSLVAWRALSGNANGFGGDLRFGKPTGLEGADEICRQIAERSMPGNGKTWRAFLSVAMGPGGTPVNAIDRIGAGPWYDRRGRLLAQTKADVGSGALRPTGADPAIINDLPNEDGVPNHNPDGTVVDNHHFMTGSTATGTLYTSGATATCQDWTTIVGTAGRPRCGFSWPRSVGGTQANGAHWLSGIDEAGCAAAILITGSGGAPPGSTGVGSGGGYGGIYCFALTP